jgi:hypothetical protein
MILAENSPALPDGAGAQRKSICDYFALLGWNPRVKKKEGKIASAQRLELSAISRYEARPAFHRYVEVSRLARSLCPPLVWCCMCDISK